METGPNWTAPTPKYKSTLLGAIAKNRNKGIQFLHSFFVIYRIWVALIHYFCSFLLMLINCCWGFFVLVAPDVLGCYKKQVDNVAPPPKFKN